MRVEGGEGRVERGEDGEGMRGRWRGQGRRIEEMRVEGGEGRVEREYNN